jgi:parvulin-like peptidyl-prolyl isomerase
MQDSPVSPRLLVAGAVLGALLAATGLLESSDALLPADQVALVNGQPITKADFLGYLELLARDKRNPLDDSDRRHVLDRVIEERLMVDRGLELGLPHSDPAVRKTIVNAMIQLAIADSANVEPDERALAEFFDANRAYFTPADRLQLRRLVFRGEGSASRATEAHRRLATEDWAAVATELADTDLLSLPSSPLPVTKLRGYLGPSLTDAALQLPPGSISEPIADQGGYTILQVLSHQGDAAPPLPSIREQVAREYRRRAGDQALRDYLEGLRRHADVSVDEEFLAGLNRLDAP